MSLQNFISNYSEENLLDVIFAWNGKFSDEFYDDNAMFRMELLAEFEKDPSVFPLELVVSLYEAETEFAEKAWGIKSIVSELASQILERGRSKYLEEYYKGTCRGFDAYIVCSRLNLSDDCLKELINFCSKETYGNCFPTIDHSRKLKELFWMHLDRSLRSKAGEENSSEQNEIMENKSPTKSPKKPWWRFWG